jgi:hypothetical protein
MDATKEHPDTHRESPHEPFSPPVPWGDVIRRHEEQGGHFFDDDTMRFHSSLLHGTPTVGPDGHAYAVVSSKAPPTGPPGHRTEEPRRYQVIRCAPDGSVERPHPEEDPHAAFTLRFTGMENAFSAVRALTTEPTDSEDELEPLEPDHFRWY